MKLYSYPFHFLLHLTLEFYVHICQQYHASELYLPDHLISHWPNYPLYMLEYLLSLETTNTFILYDYGKQISPSYRASCREVFRDKFWSYASIWIILVRQAYTSGVLEMCIYSFKKFVILTSGSAYICGKACLGNYSGTEKRIVSAFEWAFNTTLFVTIRPS